MEQKRRSTDGPRGSYSLCSVRSFLCNHNGDDLERPQICRSDGRTSGPPGQVARVLQSSAGSTPNESKHGVINVYRHCCFKNSDGEKPPRSWQVW